MIANSDRAADYAQVLLDSGAYCSTKVEYDGHSHVLTRDGAPS